MTAPFSAVMLISATTFPFPWIAMSYGHAVPMHKSSRTKGITAKPLIETGPPLQDDLSVPGSYPPGDPAGKGKRKKPGGSRWMLILALLLGLLIFGGMGGWFLLRHRSAALPVVEVASKASAAAAKAEPESHETSIALEPFIANLADAGGHSYLRVALTLRMQLPKSAVSGKKSGETAKNEGGDLEMAAIKAAARDVILGVLNRQSAEQLLQPDGKEQLKATLKAAFATQSPPLHVTEIYFTDFLVQR